MKRFGIVAVVLLGAVMLLGAANGGRRQPVPKNIKVLYTVGADNAITWTTPDGNLVAPDGKVTFVRQPHGTKQPAVLVHISRMSAPGGDSYDLNDGCQFKLGKHGDADNLNCTPEGTDPITIKLDFSSLTRRSQPDPRHVDKNRDGPQVVIDGSRAPIRTAPGRPRR